MFQYVHTNIIAKDHPTLEIFSCGSMEDACRQINLCGIAHLAFEVDDVEETLRLLLELSAFGSLSGLLPAWSWKLIRQWENDLVWNITKAGFSAWRPIRMKTGKTMGITLLWSHTEVRNIGSG